MVSRALVYPDSGLPRKNVAGDGNIVNLKPDELTADSNTTLTWNNFAGGLIIKSGHTAGRTLTFPTAASIQAQLVKMEIGESILIKVSNQPAFALTIAAGAGGTLASTKSTVPASSYGEVLFAKTGESTYNVYVL